MWIGSAGGGLYRFERNQLQVLNSDNVNLPSDTVTALVLADDGSLLVLKCSSQGLRSGGWPKLLGGLSHSGTARGD